MLKIKKNTPESIKLDLGELVCRCLLNEPNESISKYIDMVDSTTLFIHVSNFIEPYEKANKPFTLEITTFMEGMFDMDVIKEFDALASWISIPTEIYYVSKQSFEYILRHTEESFDNEIVEDTQVNITYPYTYGCIITLKDESDNPVQYLTLHNKAPYRTKSRIVVRNVQPKDRQDFI